MRPRHGKTDQLRFNSWGEALAYAQLSPRVSSPSSRDISDDRDIFTETHSFEDAIALATNGWADGEKQIRALSEKFTDRLSSMVERTNVVFDVEGFALDVATWVKGEPEHWMRFDTEIVEGEGKIIVIAVNPSVHCGISTASIRTRGAAMVALINLLELAGHQIELQLRFRNSVLDTRILLKAADQPLDMARIAFAVAHPSFVRRFMFSMMEQFPETFTRSYGYVEAMDITGADIVLDGSQEWSDEMAQAWIIEQLKGQHAIS